MKRGLFVGRFQPFHKGHMTVVENMAEANDLEEIILGIGSAQVKGTSYNPFSADERKMMVKVATENLNKPVHIIKIDDINNYDTWVEHVEKLCPEFQVVYSGNAIVSRLFEEKGYEVRRNTDERNISGTELRGLILREGDWKKFVPEKVAMVMNELGVVNKIREINSKYFKPNVCTDIVINYKGEGIVLIQRGHEPFRDKWAFPGGYFDIKDYNLKESAARELFEETGIKIPVEELKLIGEYSDFGRDPRGPTISVAYYAEINKGEIKAGDDAKNIQVIKKIPSDLAFDHNRIWEDCQKKYCLGE